MVFTCLHSQPFCFRNWRCSCRNRDTHTHTAAAQTVSKLHLCKWVITLTPLDSDTLVWLTRQSHSWSSITTIRNFSFKFSKLPIFGVQPLSFHLHRRASPCGRCRSSGAWPSSTLPRLKAFSRWIHSESSTGTFHRCGYCSSPTADEQSRCFSERNEAHVGMLLCFLQASGSLG